MPEDEGCEMIVSFVETIGCAAARKLHDVVSTLGGSPSEASRERSN